MNEKKITHVINYRTDADGHNRGRLVSVVAYFDRPSSYEKRQKKE